MASDRADFAARLVVLVGGALAGLRLFDVVLFLRVQLGECLAQIFHRHGGGLDRRLAS
jgi:hypothetical protein